MLAAMHTTVIRTLVATRREILSGLNHHRLAETRLAHDLEHVSAVIRLASPRTGQRDRVCPLDGP